MRTRTPVTGGVANLIQRIVLDAERIDLPALPPVVGGSWGDLALDGLWGPLRVEGASLFWEACARGDARSPAHAKLERIDGFRNLPARLELADGRRVTARFGHTSRSGGRIGMPPGPTCEFNVWQTDLAAPATRWVGRMKGGGFWNGNFSVLSVADGRYRLSHTNLRLEGNYVWYLFMSDKRPEAIDVVVDTGGAALDQKKGGKLGIDFNALQLTLGCPLQLDALVGLDDPGNIIGCAGTHLGGGRQTKRERISNGPAPDDTRDECWLPVFFRGLTEAMTNDADLPWGVAVNAYVDSVSDATIDGRYLKLHVALETLAKALLKKQQTKENGSTASFLVKDKKKWVAWVKKHREELAAFVLDDTKVDVFVSKVISAMNTPSSGVVANALSRLRPPLLVDVAALDELEKRNIPAHHYTMNAPGIDYEVDRDVRRIEILRSLLAALVARASGYEGAIAGWVAGEATGWRTQADWWPAPSNAALREARLAFVCERGPLRPVGATSSRTGTSKKVVRRR